MNTDPKYRICTICKDIFPDILRKYRAGFWNEQRANELLEKNMDIALQLSHSLLDFEERTKLSAQSITAYESVKREIDDHKLHLYV